MAITTTTFSKSVGWARTDVIAQLESAFSYLGWHGGALSGIVTGIVGFQTGGNYGPGLTTYHASVLQSSDRKSTRLNSSHIPLSRMPSSA